MTALLSTVTLQPGDTVQFQASSPGGTATFHETWRPNGSGTPASPITLEARPGDTVINDCQDAIDNAILLSAVSNIVIKGFVLTHTNQGVILVNGGSGITIQDCTITNDLTGTPGSTDKTGITAVNAPVGLNILNNTISTGEGSLNAQTDSMIITGSNVVIQGNTCIMHNADTNGNHNDCIQTLNVTNLTIEDNIIDRDVNAMPTQGQGIYTEWYNHDDSNITNYGTCIIRNNLVFGNGGSFLVQTAVKNDVGQADAAIVNLQIQNNTIDAYDYSSSLPFRIAYGGTWIDGSLDFRNNILIARRTTGLAETAIFDPPFTSNKFLCDYNHYYAPAANSTTTILSKTGTFYNWSAWQAAGFDTHGIGYSSGWINPRFISQAMQNYHLQSQSPDAGAGANLSNFFSADADGNTRSPTGPWDIGYTVKPIPPTNAEITVQVH